MPAISRRTRVIEGAHASSLPVAELIADGRPAILRGIARDLPLVAAGLKGAESAIAFLKQFDGGRPVTAYIGDSAIAGRFRYTADCMALNFVRESGPLSGYLDQLLGNLGNPDAPAIYIGSTDIDQYLPGLREQAALAFGDPQLVAHPPLTSIWIGNRTVASAHYDMSNNIAVTLVGHRRFTLFPPDQVANLYPGPLDLTPAGQVVSMVDFDAPDLTRYPRFAEAIAAAEVAEMEPGDALIYPALWWHQVEALDPFNAMINYWWNASPRFMDTPQITLLHAMLSLRDRPDAEKAAWRELFDYYIFGPADRPAAHLPDAARGNLGPLDELKARRLRATLLNKLNREESPVESQKVKRVVIAGGGTAGWNIAAALSRTLGTLLDITLIESEEIGTIGVGESTVPTVRSFHALLGIDEQEFMRDNRASFKLGILFEDWARQGDRYIHSFGVVGKSIWMGDFHHFWLHAKAQGWGGEIGDYCFEYQAAAAKKFATGEKSTINYAYHLDASLYARFLRKAAEGQGVKRVEGKIVTVDQHPESGFVTALNLETGIRVEGDLFIDCTGFRGLLIEQTLGAGFEDWGQWLPTNSALPIQTQAVGPAAPYTRAIAHEGGWMWQIPLQHRVGNGFVYSSDMMTDEAAHDGLHSRIEGEVVFAPKPIRFRAGRRLKSWDKNVVAFGLSAGFVEPLESTSIHLIQAGVTRLIQSFPFAGISQSQVDRYNQRAQDEAELVRDFVVLHYKLTEREDSEFWRYCKNMSVPDSLAARIALFRESGMAYQAQDELFRVDSWLQVMIGQRLIPQAYHHMGRLMTDDQLRGALGDLKTNIASAVARMPTHQEFVDSYCGAEALA